ncbi:MAG: DUF3500 domain-containing protein [Planctomycetia bacterium]|nr:DUF3500 domain-containing protein [Planctomycetia bacterium]
MTTPNHIPAQSVVRLPRRGFLSGMAAVAGATTLLGSLPAAIRTTIAAQPVGVPAAGQKKAETLAQILHASLSSNQKEAVCFPWDYVHPKFGLLRTRVGNNWNATEPSVGSSFFTKDQQHMVREIFEHLIEPEWHARFDKQLEDDTGGFGHDQSIALIGEPGSGTFQFLLTGRHMTLRCDGDSAEHVAFGGPIFYGHDAGGFNEGPAHSGNVFWSQAVAANGVYKMMDGRQRGLAMVEKLPPENAVAFRDKKGDLPGIPVTEFSADQRAELQRVLAMLLEPFRTSDRDEARQCLEKQGGIESCRLAFYREGDLGNDGVWDCWRLEGPSLVWHYRGAPHVHVWVNIADTPTIATNS